ncbi:site-2 protease family protein [Polycladomyces zharkentensis]|nr:site-2 protease family protein [Polycladomyces sp. WAk]
MAHRDTRNSGMKKTWWGGLIALLIGLGGKLKFLLPILKLGKAGGTVWTMLLSIGAYALFYPWTFALGLVAMMLVHEMGHVWAARRKGLPVSAPSFIPFVGALIMMRKMPADAVTEAYIAYGGPFVGTIGAVLCLAIGVATGYEPLYSIAQVGFLLNLFNLLPIHPLDGGRIVSAISRWLWVVGLVAGLVLVIVTFSPLLLVIWLLFAWELWSSFLSDRRNKPRKIAVEAFVPESRWEEAHVWIPAESHQRVLPHVQYCRVADREHVCSVNYPGVGEIFQFEGMKGRFEEVRMTGADRVTDDTGQPLIRLRLEAEYVPSVEEDPSLRKSAEYYQVSGRTRFVYGVMYFGLMLVLVLLMGVTHMLISGMGT